MQTGPRTAEGEAASSSNAIYQGLSASQLAVTPQDREQLDELLAHYRTEINPRGPVQHTLFDELVAAARNLRRVRLLQAAGQGSNPPLPGWGKLRPPIFFGF